MLCYFLNKTYIFFLYFFILAKFKVHPYARFKPQMVLFPTTEKLENKFFTYSHNFERKGHKSKLYQEKKKTTVPLGEQFTKT